MAAPGGSQGRLGLALFWEPCCEQGAVWMDESTSVVRGLETVAFEESFQEPGCLSREKRRLSRGQASCCQMLKGHRGEEGAGLSCGAMAASRGIWAEGRRLPSLSELCEDRIVAWGTRGPPPLTLPGGGSRHQGASQAGLAASPTRFLPESRPSPRWPSRSPPWRILTKGGSQQVLLSTGLCALLSWVCLAFLGFREGTGSPGPDCRWCGIKAMRLLSPPSCG